MKHEIKLTKGFLAVVAFAFCFGIHSIIAMRLEPGSSMITSPKENINHRVKTQNIIKKESDEIKKALVIVKSRPEVPFISDTDEIITATGFIVDIEQGIIVTTRKAARISPSFIKIQFYDGTIRQGKVLYSDNIVPFGIVKINGSMWEKEKEKYKSLKIGDCYDESFKPNLELEIIGMGLEGTYITKKGKIINTNRNFSSRYGALFQTSFDRATNLNGSPVLNGKKEVIGLHVIATSTTSYELKINHISNVLNQIIKNTPIKKADIGISVDLVILGIAKSNYKLKDEIAEEISKNIISSGGPPEVMLISSVFPSSNANNILKSGDIIYKINDVIVGNDFLKFEDQINDSLFKNKNLSVTVSRNSEIVNLNIPKVDNSQDYLVDKYISFSGAYFHDVTKLVKYYLYSELEGVYLTYNNVGSPFSKIAVSNQQNKSNYILTAINSIPIKNINELVEFFRNNCDLESIYLEGIDYNIFSGKLNSDAVDLDFNNSLLQKFIFSKKQFKWDVESLDLRQYCKSTSKKQEEEKNEKNKKNRLNTSNKEGNVNTYNSFSNVVNNGNNTNVDESYYNEISNIDENIILNKENKITNTKTTQKNILNRIDFEFANSEISMDKSFYSKPVIEKRKVTENSNKLELNETILNSVSEKKTLNNLNEFKFKEKMNKLKISKIQADFASNKIQMKSKKEISMKIIKEILNSEKLKTSEINLKNITNSSRSFIEYENKTNIKEDEKKIKFSKDKLEDMNKLINLTLSQYRSESENLYLEKEKMKNKKLIVLNENSKINNKSNIFNFTFPYNNSTSKNKNKEDSRKNMLDHLVRLHTFHI